jgi:hypothetical protein
METKLCRDTGFIAVLMEQAQLSAEKITGISGNSVQLIKREEKSEFGKDNYFQTLINEIKWNRSVVDLDKLFGPIFRRQVYNFCVTERIKL